VFQTRRDPQTNPCTNVFLRVGGRQVLVMRHVPDEFHATVKADYKDNGVPAQALAACSGWWAGAGDTLYAIRQGRSLVIYRQETEEQGQAFPWKRVKTISFPS
ncbi:MAG: hypothetical protein ACRYFS_12240, partial [Janthinobacterium lividum]